MASRGRVDGSLATAHLFSEEGRKGVVACTKTFSMLVDDVVGDLDRVMN